MDRETKQESSIPVQCRVSIVTLAGLAKYWKVNSYDIKTVSQLISWSLYLLAEILTTNGHMGREPSIGEAREFLMSEGLYQKSSIDRSYKKITAAIRFEGMRQEGTRPHKKMTGDYDRMTFNTMHKDPNQGTGKASSVEPFMGRVSNERAEEATRIYESIKPEDVRRLISDESINREYNELPALKLNKLTKEDYEERMRLSQKVVDDEAAALDKFLAAAKAEKSI